MNEIYLDYDKARNQARELLYAADEAVQIKNNIKNMLNTVHSHWEGQAAESFINALQKRIIELNKIESDLRNTANQINYIINEMEAKEKRIKKQIALMSEKFKDIAEFFK